MLSVQSYLNGKVLPTKPPVIIRPFLEGGDGVLMNLDSAFTFTNYATRS